MIIPGSSSFLELGFTETIGKPGLAAMVVQVHDGLVETSYPVEFFTGHDCEAPRAIELDDGWLVGAQGNRCERSGASCSGRPLFLFHIDANGTDATPLGTIQEPEASGYTFYGQVGNNSMLLSEGRSEPGPSIPVGQPGYVSPGDTRTYTQRYLLHDLATRETTPFVWSPPSLTSPVGTASGPGLPEPPPIPSRHACATHDRLWVLDATPNGTALNHTLTTLPLRTDATPHVVPIEGATEGYGRSL